MAWCKPSFGIFLQRYLLLILLTLTSLPVEVWAKGYAFWQMSGTREGDYFKASANTVFLAHSHGMNFGYSVSIDGDTLAVAAPFEDSSATGVGGNQANNTAADSGAVYVFTRLGTGGANKRTSKLQTPVTVTNSELR